MLAASHLSSNVPPDDLQVAPVVALLAVCANQFGKHVPGGGSHTQPTYRLQQDAAGYELHRMPFMVGIENPDLTICNELQPGAPGPGAAQMKQFPQSHEAPQNYAENT